MLPPGLAFISFSEKAWEAHAESTMPRFYLDMAEYKRYYEIGQPPFTPSVSCMFALDLALNQIVEEGMGSVFERHASIGQYTRDGISKLGLTIFPNSDKIASNTCTAVTVPEGIDGSKLVSKMREDHNVVLAGGQASLAGKIFRIGHMGQTTEADIDGALNALKIVLPEIGFTSGS